MAARHGVQKLGYYYVDMVLILFGKIKGFGNIRVFMSEFIQRLKDCYLQEWNDNVTSNRKLDVYRNIKTTVELDQYINCIREIKHISVLAKFRTSNHTLAIETGRHGQSQPRVERICLFCKYNLDITVIEDECHFLISCPAYTNKRYQFVSVSSHQNKTKCIHLIGKYVAH